MSKIEVAAFYKFAHLPDFVSLRDTLQKLCDVNAVRGILLVAREGINGTLAGTPAAMARVLGGIRATPGLQNLEHKSSYCDQIPFLRMKVRLKKEIVTIGDLSVDPTARVGTYVEPAHWNALIADPDVMLIDTRNDFEVRIGTFKGAINPHTISFSDFPGYVEANINPRQNKKVAMFCTGGIRCEKASSYMLDQGFEEVFHLKGGILKYLETVPEAESQWEGSCFVFDQRVSVTHGLQVSDLKLCYGCRAPLEQQDIASPNYEEGVSCPHCSPLLTPEKRAAGRMRQRQIQLDRARGKQHLGPQHVRLE